MLFEFIQETESKNHKVGKFIGRLLFLYFVLLLLPLNTRFWGALAGIPQHGLDFTTIFNLARYTPSIGAGIIQYYHLLWLALTAGIGAVVWLVVKPAWTNFPTAYYWLRSAIRVRLFIGVVVYAWIKIFPLLSPYPSLSDMNTTMGELTAWKLFTTSIGIVPGYQSFIGKLELVATFLLLSRKTASIGAFVLICALGNAWITNIVYDGGEGAYSFYLLSLAVFVFGHDAHRLYQLTVQRKFTRAELFSPVFNRTWITPLKKLVKLSLLVLTAWFGITAYANSGGKSNKYPTGRGLPAAAGLYKVTRFVFNGVEHPPSLYDTLRWKDVVFEPWSTISIRTQSGALPLRQDTQEFPVEDEQRSYEAAGNAGREYFSYAKDSSTSALVLRNKKNKDSEIDFWLQFHQPDSVSMILTGKTRLQDTIYVELQKIDKVYLLNESFKNAKLKKY